MDVNTVHIFQQLLKQQQENQLVMTKMIESMAGSEGTSHCMNPPVNYGHKLRVPEWNKEMTFEMWKRKIVNFKTQSSMNENQKLILILESLKKIPKDKIINIG